MPNNMAMHEDSLSVFVRLPSAQQRRVRNLISRFSTDPTGSGLNYERIQGAADRAMRSLLYVAATRAKKASLCVGRPSRFLRCDCSAPSTSAPPPNAEPP